MVRRKRREGEGERRIPDIPEVWNLSSSTCLASIPFSRSVFSLVWLRYKPELRTSHSGLKSKDSGFDIKERTLFLHSTGSYSTLVRTLEADWLELQSLLLAQDIHWAVGTLDNFLNLLQP